MKIKMLTLASGPRGVFQPNCIREVDQVEGEQLIAGGYALEIATTPESPMKRIEAPEDLHEIAEIREEEPVKETAGTYNKPGKNKKR